MDEILNIYERLDGRTTLDDFKAKIDEKVATMGGLCDEATAALLVAQDLGADTPVTKIKDITPDNSSVTFACRVVSISGVREFSRSDGSNGRVANITVGDETGTIRVSLWDELADLVSEIDVGEHLRIGGYAKVAYAGSTEVSVGRTGHIDVIEPSHEIEISVKSHPIADLCAGMVDVNVTGQVLDVSNVRTFTRRDGSNSTGSVGNVTIGDETGKIRVTLWDDKTKMLSALNVGDSIKITGGYTRENNYDGTIEIQIGDQGTIEKSDETVDYTEDITPLSDVGLDEICTVVGYVTGLDETREITRNDEKVSRVTNIYVSDEAGKTRLRVALWGEHADMPLDIGDKIRIIDCYAKSGWKGEIELGAGWKSSVHVI
ncbi:MAG: OB-fold nucleic acid binding domain-containing protein [Euryarchaeota archaeon]|nr:OB-fold nucleic acid binding domain-containing protein [Euryarchaeota archaeon]